MSCRPSLLRPTWVFLWLVLATPLYAQLTAEGKRFATDLQRAGWTGVTSANEVTLTARIVDLCSDGMLNAVKHVDETSEDTREAFKEVVRVTLPKPGWFINTRVKPGDYALGIAWRNSDLWFVLHDQKGVEITSVLFRVESTTSALPTSAVNYEGGSWELQLTVGGIDFHWYYTSDEAFNGVVAGLPSVDIGKLTIHSDLFDLDALEHVAKAAGKLPSAFRGLFGTVGPNSERHVYIFATREKYEAIEKILTRGRFKSHGAFTAHLTRHSYIWYPGTRDSTQPAGSVRVWPRHLYGLVVHELCHQLTWATWPGSEYWPTYFQEGVAEYVAYLTLKKVRLEQGHEDDARGSWIHTRLADPTRALLDLDSVDGGIASYYSGCYFLVKELAKSKSKLKGLVKQLAKSPATKSREVARAYIEKRYRRTPKELLQVVDRRIQRKGEPGVVLSGFTDRYEDRIRIVSPEEMQGMVIFPEVAGKELSFSFAYASTKKQQADIYLCYRYDAPSVEFLKLAVTPTQLELYHCKDNVWTTLDTKNLEKPLTIGQLDGEASPELTWHSVKLVLGASTVKVSLNESTSEEFTVDKGVLARDGRIGIGSYGGVVYFADPRDGG